MAHKYFTVEEAEHILPQVKRHMTRLMTIHDEVTALMGVKVQAHEFDWNAHLLTININKRFHELSYKYFQELEEITKLGCYVKDAHQGLVDFYSKFGDKDILLCWQYDESNILYYHDEMTGFNGRRPIRELKQQLARQREALL